MCVCMSCARFLASAAAWAAFSGESTKEKFFFLSHLHASFPSPRHHWRARAARTHVTSGNACMTDWQDAGTPQKPLLINKWIVSKSPDGVSVKLGWHRAEYLKYLSEQIDLVVTCLHECQIEKTSSFPTSVCSGTVIRDWLFSRFTKTHRTCCLISRSTGLSKWRSNYQ